MKFVVVDVETANASFASICQIGIATFEDNKLAEEWQSLINPEEDFDRINISIHGIDEKKVIGKPTFKDAHAYLRQKFENNIVVSHMPFDKVAIRQATEKYNLQHIPCRWLDSARVARRTWHKFAYSGYGLKNIASELGIEFKHHDALEDAKAAGFILLKSIQETSTSLEEWLLRVEKPIFSLQQRTQQNLPGNPDGPLFGETIVFTGQLNLSRGEAAILASKAGCQVDPTVTKRTTILIVGNQDIRRLNGQEKSSKHRKAEYLITKGQNIRILTENDFVSLVGHA